VSKNQYTGTYKALEQTGMRGTMLNYAPTFVIGVGEREEASLKATLNEMRFWLRECYPQVTPIVRMGLVVDSALIDLTERVGEPVGDDLLDGMRRWCEAVASVHAIDRVRTNAVMVAGTERLELRVVLVFFSDCPHAQVEAVLDALSAATESSGVVLCITAIVIVRTDWVPSVPAVQAWLETLRPFAPAYTVFVLRRHRSNGSTVEEAALPLVVQFLLLTALAPYESPRHPFFESNGTQTDFSTVGLGLIYVPLPHISRAAGNFLAYELSSLALDPNPHPSPPRWNEAAAIALDETDFWQALFDGIEEVAEVRAEPNAIPEQRFRVALRKGTVLIDLSRTPWHRRKERLIDYELTWGWLLREFWLPKMQHNAARKQQEADEAIVAVLDTIAQQGVGVFAAVERTLEHLTRRLHEWQCAKPGTPRGVEPAGAQHRYEALERAIADAPNPYAVLTRALLTLALIGYTAFALARWDWLTAALNEAVRAIFAGAPPWSAWGLIGGAALMATVAVVWKAIQTIRVTHERVEQATQDALRALEAAITSHLREMGLQLLQQIQSNFLNRLHEWAAMNRQGQEDFERVRENWHAKARAFDPPHTPLTRAAVQRWEQLEPKLRQRLTGQDLPALWRQTLQNASVNAYETLINRLSDQTLEAMIYQAAQQLWIEQLRGEQMRRISDYLPVSDPDHMRRLLDECYQESRVYLAQSARSAVGWQLHAVDETELNNHIQQTAQTQLGGSWIVLQLPAVAGFVQLGWVDYAPPIE
jgi:hypothetical protein